MIAYMKFEEDKITNIEWNNATFWGSGYQP